MLQWTCQGDSKTVPKLQFPARPWFGVSTVIVHGIGRPRPFFLPRHVSGAKAVLETTMRLHDKALLWLSLLIHPVLGAIGEDGKCAIFVFVPFTIEYVSYRITSTFVPRGAA